MKRSFVATALAVLPFQVMADCGEFPKTLEIFEAQQLTIPQLTPMEDEFNGYLKALEEYTSCVDQEMAELDSEADDYQSTFELYVALHQNIELAKTTSIDRYNFLIEHAVDERFEEGVSEGEQAPSPNSEEAELDDVDLNDYEESLNGPEE